MTVSLRDYLAAHASEADVERWREWESQTPTVKGLCKRSAEEARYAFADAMLQAKKGPEGKEGAQQTTEPEETPGQWHLPSRDVLNAMYQHKDKMGGLSPSIYWSSSERNSNNAWSQNFNDGWQFNYYKGDSFRARAVRALLSGTTETDRLFEYDGALYQAYHADAPKAMAWDEAVAWCAGL